MAKFDPAGQHVWSKPVEGHPSRIAVHSSGNVLMTGMFEDTLHIGGAQLTGAGESDIFVAKLWP